MSGLSFSIRKAWGGDVPAMVQCHREAFPGQFMTLIGDGFLSCHYEYYCAHPEAICLVAETFGEVVGFVVGGPPYLRSAFTYTWAPLFAKDVLHRAAGDGRVRRRLLQHLKFAMSAAGRHLLRMPPKDRLSMGDQPGTWVTLLSICVRPAFGGNGIGRALLRRFESEAAHRGFEVVHLSVRKGNEPAIRLYQSEGWEATLVGSDGIYYRKLLRGRKV